MESSRFLERPTSRACKIPKRYIVSALMGVAMFIWNWMRTNIAAVIIHTLLRQRYSDTFFPEEELWTYEDIAMMDSAFYWGCAAGQIPGALLVICWSAHKAIITSMAFSSMIHLFLPMALNHHVKTIVALNVLQGLVQGPVFPACFGILLQWTPSRERARHLSLVISGSCFGLLLSVPFSNLLVDNMGEEIGVFSASMGGLIWCGIWSVFIFPSPSEDPYITHKELSFLEENTDKEIKTSPTLKSVPLKGILMSSPVYGICIAGSCFVIDTFIAYWAPLFNLNNYDIMSDDHMYLHIYAPKFFIALAVLLAGLLSDFLVNGGFLRTGTTRKIMTCGGLGVYGILILVASQLHDEVAVMVLHHLSAVFLGLSAVGYTVNCFDVCPRYACFVVGYYETITSIAGIVFSIIIEKELQLHNLNEWNKLLWIIAGVNLAAAVAFGILGSGERQPWDTVTTDLHDVKCGSDASCYPVSSAEESSELIEESTLNDEIT